MTDKIARILASHGIDTRQHGTRLFALDSYTYMDADGSICTGSDWVDVTDFTLKQIYGFLGY